MGASRGENKRWALSGDFAETRLASDLLRPLSRPAPVPERPGPTPRHHVPQNMPEIGAPRGPASRSTRVSERRKMAKRKGPSTSGPRTRRKAAKEGREERDPGSIQWLDKLPLEVWDKILDHLESDDLFPLALSCRYFRQKQKELVARTRQSGRESGKPRLTLKTTLRKRTGLDWTGKAVNCHPASADYLRFCSNEKAPCGYVEDRDRRIRILAAYRGHLPLLPADAQTRRAPPCRTTRRASSSSASATSAPRPD